MHIFRVWAHIATSVEVYVAGRSYPMSRAGHGWWEARVSGAEPGEDYGFSVDGGDVVPDPRSRWQPNGVHALSRLIRSEFTWTDQKWSAPPLASGILYELHIGTFTPQGTFRAAIEKLDYLAELGITHIELMPIADFAGEWGWGYDGVDLFAPNHHYGTPYDLKALIDACHQRGLAAVLDVVYNHFGPSGNYLGKFGPYTADRYHTPWGNSVNLDGPCCGGVRSFFIDNAVMWLREYHFDGLRLDAVHALIDNGAYHFLEQLADRVKALEAELGRRLVLVGESDLNDPRIIQPPEIGGYGIDAQSSDDFHHALHVLLTGEQTGYYADFRSESDLAKALTQAYVYDGCFSEYRQRGHGRPPTDLPGYRFVVCTQNHDQVGNRAKGERLSHLAGPAKAKIAAALLMTSPFVPLIFQGEEWAASTPFQYFTHHEEPDLARAVSEGRRNEFAGFGWTPADVPDPQDAATFLRSKLNWQELEERPHDEMLQWYRSLIRLRTSTPDLRNGDLDRVRVQVGEHQGWLLMQRGEITIACNFSNESRCVFVKGCHHVLLANGAGIQPVTDGTVLPPESVVILGTGC